MPKLLVIDDRDQTIELCHRHLPEFEYVTRCGRPIPCNVCEQRERACPMKCAHDYFEAERVLRELERLPDLVVLDLHFGIPKERLLPVEKSDMPVDGKAQRTYLDALRRRQGLLILERLRADYPRLPVVMLTTTDVELGDARPEDPLVYLCENEIVDSRSLVTEIRRALLLSHETEEGCVYWGKSPSMAGVRRSLGILARSPLPTLIEGETGTGKSYLAEHFIHPRSGVKGRLVVTDLSTIPASLLPAHLFGSKRGAYTGATADHAGVFEQAHQGTLFLDEIANLDLDLQRQLLLVLERNEVTRLGDQLSRPASVKLVAATNQDLASLVELDRFRRDLFMRLNPATRIRLPALRDRTEDIPDLVRFSLLEALTSASMVSLVHAFLVKYPTLSSFDASGNAVWFRRPAARLASPNAFTIFMAPTTLKRLVEHPWPGNHRELRLFTANLLVFTLCQLLEGPDTSNRARAPAVITISDDLVDGLLPTSESKTRSLSTPQRAADVRQRIGERRDGVWVEIPEGLGFARTASQIEKQYLEQLYLRYRGDLAAMAQRLLGPQGQARQVHLRLNQLGLKIKALRQQLSSGNRPGHSTEKS
ncbi:MAG TPA: sigma 54-interacting transcriptional regulator [Polyangiaceae bacterium]